MVIAIIAVLISLVAPALKNARQQAVELWCKSNLHQLALAFHVFGDDHQGRFPGGLGAGNVGNEAYMNDWLGAKLWAWSDNIKNAPQTGTLFEYTSGDKRIFLCPALEPAPLYSGLGSNGSFDYASSLKFTGASFSRIPLAARYKDNTLGEYVDSRTPMVMDEAVFCHINFWSIEGSHSWVDRLGTQHRDGANVAAVDGSVYWIMEPYNTDFRYWEAVAPSGKWTSLGAIGSGIYPDEAPNVGVPGWGSWDHF